MPFSHPPYPLVRVLCLPDVDKPIGGVKQLYRHVEHLVQLGLDAAILTEKPGFKPSWFTSSAPTLSLIDSHSRGELTSSQCILVVPETYIGVNFSSFRGLNLSSLSRVVFNQNAYYTYGNLTNVSSSVLNSFYLDPLVLQVLSVSEDTYEFLAQNLSIPDSSQSRIINSVEPILWSDLPKEDIFHWMPRKNPDHVTSVISGIQNSFKRSNSSWTGEALVNLSHSDVADKLNASRIFLSFGHPEGFGLPIAEAMASGCWVIGYHGGGGRELFRFGASDSVGFGDWTNFVSSVNRAFEFLKSSPREANLRIQRQASIIRHLYSSTQESRSIELAWERIFQQFAAI